MPTVGTQISQMIEDALLSAYIVSPRFDDYEIVSVKIPRIEIEQAIDEEIGKIVEQSRAEGGNGEFEDHLANLINDENNMYADAELTDEELDSLGKHNTPLGIGEKEGVGLAKAGLSVAKSPMSVVAPLMGTLPHAALVLLAAALAPLIIDELKKPGSMLDVRWRRIMFEEFNALMQRQDQWNAQIGLRQTYVQSFDGFLIGNGAAYTESNLRRVRESDDRIADRLEFTDHAKEFFR